MTRRAFRLFAIVVAAGAACLIIFLGLMPRPDVLRLDVLPARWARFIDTQYTLRHVAAFFAFHLLLVSLGSLAGWLNARRRRIGLIFVLAVFALLLELAQFPLPHRSVNFDDILASWAGLALGFILSESLRALRSRSKAAAHPPHVS